MKAGHRPAREVALASISWPGGLTGQPEVAVAIAEANQDDPPDQMRARRGAGSRAACGSQGCWVSGLQLGGGH